MLQRASSKESKNIENLFYLPRISYQIFIIQEWMNANDRKRLGGLLSEID